MTRRVLVAVMLAATASFVVGVALERNQTANESSETPAQHAAEARRSGENGGGEPNRGSGESAGSGEGTHAETGSESNEATPRGERRRGPS